MKYTLWFASGSSRTAPSLREAVSIARRVLGASRVYRGSRYVTHDGDEALDIWTRLANATDERGGPADCVITWLGRGE